MQLDDADRADLDGANGEARRLAMRVIERVGRAAGAERLLDVTGAHIDGCLYHGQAGLDFAERLVADGGAVSVPTTLNVSSLDLLHPDLYRGEPEEGRLARRLMDAYVELGCRPTWTCAPYQAGGDDDPGARPALGEHVAWAESNAIVFANSVLGARTARYGDFIDICAAITGRAPAMGLHLDGERRPGVVVDATAIADLLPDEHVAGLLGHVIGERVGSRVPLVVGVPVLDEDALKALGSAGASSGALALVHVAGTTPEADDPTIVGDAGGLPRITVTKDDLERARTALTSTGADPDGGSRLGAVSLGTPHYSVGQFERLVELVAGRRAAVPCYVSTGRAVWQEVELRGWDRALESFGCTIVTDTCTYVTSVMAPFDGVAMTDSPKWAWYAPGNLDVAAVYGSVEECVESAVLGRVVRRPLGSVA